MSIFYAGEQKGLGRFRKSTGTTPEPPPPTSPTVMTGVLTRRNGSIETRSRGFWSFAPGVCNDLSKVQVFLNADAVNTEQAIYIEEAQGGRHPDGTFKLVYLEYVPTAPVGIGQQLPVVVRVGNTRTTTDITKQGFTTPFPHPTKHIGADGTTRNNKQAGTHNFQLHGYPRVTTLPNDPVHLIACNLLEPMNTRAHELSLGGKFTDTLNHFELGSNNKWNHFGSTSWPDVFENDIENVVIDFYFYDRALNHYAHYIRSGNIEYYFRACAYLYNWRAAYAQVSEYGIPTHEEFFEGLMLHNWLTGDPESRRGVERMITWELGSVTGDEQIFSRSNSLVDPRGGSRVIWGLITAHKLGFATLTSRHTGQTVNTLAKIDEIVNKARGIGVFNNTPMWDGEKWLQPFGAGCPDVITLFMQPMCCDKLIKYHTWINPAATWVIDIVKANQDWLWNNHWRPNRGLPEQSYDYLTGPCPGEGDQTPTNDLNNFYTTCNSWLFRMTGNTIYRDRADANFNGCNTQDLNDTVTEQKQFNQAHKYTFRHSKLRNG